MCRHGYSKSWQNVCYESLPVVLFVHQVIASSESHQMGVVGWCWDGNWPCAAYIGVAELVGEDLQLIWREVVVVPEHMVVRRPAGTLQRLKSDEGGASVITGRNIKYVVLI